MPWSTPKCCWTTLRFVQKEMKADWVFPSTFWLSVFTFSWQNAPKVPSTQPSGKDSGKYVDDGFILTFMCVPLKITVGVVVFFIMSQGCRKTPFITFPQTLQARFTEEQRVSSHQHSPAHPPDGSKSPEHHQQRPVQLWVLGGGRQPCQREQR